MSYHTNYKCLEDVIENGSINFTKLENNIRNWEATLNYKKDLQIMLEEGSISEQYYLIQKRNLEYVFLGSICSLFKPTPRGIIADNYKPTDAELKKLRNLLHKIYEEGNFEEVDFHKYYANNAIYYQLFYYGLCNNSQRSEFQSASGYLPTSVPYYHAFMPENMQLSILGTQAIFEAQNGVGPLYNQEFLHWYQEKFPDKEYTAILTKIWDEKANKENEKAKATLLDRTVINSLEDLVNTPDLKGKRLYIDMWASWCSPCLAQFKYNEQVEELLANHENLATVYISIDEDENDKDWKKQIDFHQLNGYHLRASRIFVDYLSRTLYDGKSVGVPRYLLIDVDGKILNDNLPRPSQTKELREALKEAIK